MALHLNADLEARYQRFVNRVRANGEVWVLLSPDMRGPWVESNHYSQEDGEPVPVHLVYSAAGYARQHATGPWEGWEPAAMDVEEFVGGPLKGMHECGDLVGPDYNSDLAGVEVDPMDLALALLGESD